MVETKCVHISLCSSSNTKRRVFLPLVKSHRHRFLRHYRVVKQKNYTKFKKVYVNRIINLPISDRPLYHSNMTHV